MNIYIYILLFCSVIEFYNELLFFDNWWIGGGGALNE